MPLQFHEYKTSNFDECCAIFVSNTPQFFAMEELPEYHGFLRKDAPGNYWVLRNDKDAIVACGGVWVKPDGSAHLCFGMVRSEYRKKGLGSLLLAWRLHKLASLPAVRLIRLDTTQYNPAFFARFGFETVKTEDNHYAPGLHRHDMELVVNDNRRDIIRETYEKLHQELAA